MIKPAMWRGATLIALSAALAAGCDDETSPTPAPGVPSLRVLGDNPACDRVFLPTVQPAELRDEAFRTMVVTVNGRDPGNASGVIDGNTAVTFEQEPQDGMGSVAFLSSYTLARTGGLDRLMALQQAGQSSGREFAGGVAADQIICVTPGSVRIRARVESYNDIGEIVSADVQSFVVACQSPAQYDEVCAPPPDDEDMTIEDMGVDGDVIEEDGGVGADAEVDDNPVLWSINFVPPPPEDDDALIIGIRNAGLGRRDNVELQFTVTELGTPLSGIPVKFVLSTITQPEVTISTGTAAKYEAEGTSIAVTSSGNVPVRLIAGNTPGLAVVRAVAMRLPASTRERAALFEEANCVDDDGEGYECMFDFYCSRTVGERDGAAREELCEVDRSGQVVIIGGIPSGRGMELDCVDGILPAFSTREGERWVTSNEPGTDCTLQLADRVNGRVSEGTQIFFLTEAGTVNQVGQTDADGRAIMRHRVGMPPPFDVESDDYELEAGFLEDGYNPRDGLVRLVAVTRGEEDFQDRNGNKIFDDLDLIEPGQDLPEPYIDANDNGRWDDDEEFRDANDDGVWTPANGEWDANTEIWTSTTVLWVGELFSCYDRGLWARRPDCGCTNPINGSPVDYDCRDNVGEVLRRSRILEATCVDQTPCSAPAPGDRGGSFVIGPDVGARIELLGTMLDVNGNCLNTRGQGTYAFATGDGLEVDGEAGGSLRRCYSAFEKPLGGQYRVSVIDTGGSEPFPEVSLTLNYMGINQVAREVRTNLRVRRDIPLQPQEGPEPPPE